LASGNPHARGHPRVWTASLLVSRPNQPTPPVDEPALNCHNSVPDTVVQTSMAGRIRRQVDSAGRGE